MLLRVLLSADHGVFFLVAHGFFFLFPTHPALWGEERGQFLVGNVDGNEWLLAASSVGIIVTSAWRRTSGVIAVRMTETSLR